MFILYVSPNGYVVTVQDGEETAEIAYNNNTHLVYQFEERYILYHLGTGIKQILDKNQPSRPVKIVSYVDIQELLETKQWGGFDENMRQQITEKGLSKFSKVYFSVEDKELFDAYFNQFSKSLLGGDLGEHER